MTKLLALAFLLLLAGCVSRQTYTEGTSLKLGIYVPAGGQLYGI